MKKFLFPLLLFCVSLSATAMEITRMEPAFWWTGMKNPELQILVYGKDIGRSELQFEYPGVRLKEMVRVENPNYLFIYLEIGERTQPGVIEFTFTDVETLHATSLLTQTYELKPRSTAVGAQKAFKSRYLYFW